MIFPIETTYGNGNIQALSIIKRLAEIEPDSKKGLLIDFSSYGETDPFSNVLFCNALRHFKSEHKEIKMWCRPKADTYLSHIGFYKACGIPYGKEPGEARASENYVPVTRKKFEGDFYFEIEDWARELAATLHFDRKLQRMIKFIFVETIRNVYEHSDVNEVTYAAQKWPRHDLVEIAIADNGCGIVGSLGKKFSETDEKLLELACKPGITAGSNHRIFGTANDWSNTGYGLYMMKRLTTAFNGSLLLCSGKKAIKFKNVAGNETETVYETEYKGTCLGLRFSTDTGYDFENIRDRIIDEGQREAAEIEGAIKKASRSSGGRYKIDI